MFTPETEQVRQEAERQVESMSTRVLHFRVANIFWVQKLLEEHPQDYNFDPYTSSPEEMSRGFTKSYAAKSGYFTFPSRRMVLGKTLESTFVPINEMWWISEKALNSRGQELPLIVHFTAPLIKPGQRGNIVFEFQNQTNQDLKVHIGRTFAKVFVLRVPGNAEESTSYDGKFQDQTWESLPFPDMRKELEEIRPLIEASKSRA